MVEGAAIVAMPFSKDRRAVDLKRVMYVPFEISVSISPKIFFQSLTFSSLSIARV